MTTTPEQMAKWREEFELAELAWLEDDLPSVKRDLLERKGDTYAHVLMRVKWKVCLATNLRAKQETEQAIKDARKQAIEDCANFAKDWAMQHVIQDDATLSVGDYVIKSMELLK